MKVIIITGVSGAGKSLVAKTLEDMGYYCIDNMPPSLIPKFVDIASQNSGKFTLLAFVVDIRGSQFLNDLFPGLESIKQAGLDYEILFLDASDNTLVKRYKESRRSHPLAAEGGLLQAIAEERQVLSNIRDKADHLIDTSNLSSAQLKEEIRKIFFMGIKFKGMVVNVISFGFKYGVPVECDLIFDVRFIPNPFYIESLKNLSGKNMEVVDYVMNTNETQTFITKITDLLDFLMPNYIKEGKTQLVLGIGCTGGRHRSVAIADKLSEIFMSRQYTVITDHRDVHKSQGNT